MPLPMLSYERYAELGGNTSEEKFPASLAHAVASVREVMGFNVPETGAQAEAYERAVRAAIDVDAYYGASGGIGEGASSITLGKFSASIGSDGCSGYDRDMARAIRRELSGSGLLYQGVG